MSCCHRVINRGRPSRLNASTNYQADLPRPTDPFPLTEFVWTYYDMASFRQ